MSMLARYKKAGGLMELVKLIEESSSQKRQQLMSMVMSEDADLAVQVQARIYSYEKLRELPEGLIAEIVAVVPPKFVAMAVFGDAETFVKLVERCLGKNFAEYKSEREIFAEKPPAQTSVEAARRKFLSEARKLEKEGRIKLPESASSSLSASNSGMQDDMGRGTVAGFEIPSASGVSQDAAPVSDTNAPLTMGTDGSKAPAIKSFGLELPPPGLTGERLEAFIKNSLGTKP